MNKATRPDEILDELFNGIVPRWSRTFYERIHRDSRPATIMFVKTFSVYVRDYTQHRHAIAVL